MVQRQPRRPDKPINDFNSLSTSDKLIARHTTGPVIGQWHLKRQLRTPLKGAVEKESCGCTKPGDFDKLAAHRSIVFACFALDRSRLWHSLAKLQMDEAGHE